MSDPELTDPIILQGRALVRAIEALGTIQPSGPFERALARLLVAAYKRRLRGIVKLTGSARGYGARRGTLGASGRRRCLKTTRRPCPTPQVGV